MHGSRGCGEMSTQTRGWLRHKKFSDPKPDPNNKMRLEACQ